MKEIVELSGFVLIMVGTIGLLLAEYVFDWGSIAVLTFAAVNVLGLVTLAFARWGMKEGIPQ